MFSLFTILVLLAGTNAHHSAFHPAMYCINGTQKGAPNLNANDMVQPLFNLDFDQWWFHKVNGCSDVPPPPGTFLDLPAGGSFTVNIADNQASSGLYKKVTSDWTDGGQHPDFYNLVSDKCISQPNLHTQNESHAAGTAFAISYQSELDKVTMDNLVIFSVRYHTPWKRVTSYDVPADMPPCPPEGCTCAWTWIPNGCGEPNIYMQGFKCKVSNSKSNTPLATPKPAVWCEGAPQNCTRGAKQFIAWNQKTGNNIQVEGYDLEGEHKSPAYNDKCGFSDGAQNDIFATSVPNKVPANVPANDVPASVPTTSVSTPSSTRVPTNAPIRVPGATVPTSVPTSGSLCKSTNAEVVKKPHRRNIRSFRGTKHSLW